ncbi:hypothetical protein [Roseiflexus sp.]
MMQSGLMFFGACLRKKQDQEVHVWMKPLSIFCKILQSSYMNAPKKVRSDASLLTSGSTTQPVMTLNAVAPWRIYEVLSTFVHQAKIFGISGDLIGLINIDPDQLLR